jgi:hypothetical protein
MHSRSITNRFIIRSLAHTVRAAAPARATEVIQ